MKAVGKMNYLAKADGKTPPFWLCLTAIILVLAIPVLVTQFPPLLDYPNHMARMYVLAFGNSDEFLSRMYRRNPATVPYMGIDLVLPRLLHFLPLDIVGRIAVGCAVIFPVIGTALYGKAVFGRFSLWQLGSALIAYHSIILLGFLNFDIGIGLCLMLGALYIRSYRNPWLTLAFACLSAHILFLDHLICAAYYLLLIFSYASSQILEDIKGAARPRQAAIALKFAMPVLAAGIVVLADLARSSFTQQEFSFQYLSFVTKLTDLALLFQNYNLPLDMATALLFYGTLYMAIRRKYLLVSPHVLIGCGILLAVYLACPFSLVDATFMISAFR